ncbi:hypothetical protein AcW2_001001 [Taiwanofungus camphoratus]|nr:hypothetical protein AcW2_001001 [Antrodia cinnamomea]
MADSSLSGTTVLLRKRKRTTSPFILRLASSPSPSCNPSESEYDAGPTLSGHVDYGPSTSQVSQPKRRFRCTYVGCDKAYTKPSRLAEHQRAHTGDRPYVCATCKKSYFRDTHLQAHARTHLPDSAKPFVCEEPECNKRFWTTQHLRVHERLHRGEKPFKCSEALCEASFSKHHQLRVHICAAHSPPGTKPYRCESVACTKSFTTSQKLRAHVKTHNEKRYTCVHQTCLPATNQPATYYPTWSALQHHMRTAHPPICPHPSCNGKTFTAQKGLRAHLKLHAERDLETQLEKAVAESADEDEEEERPLKRRRGGEVGRDWICQEAGCSKDFKSKKALTTHHNVFHLGRRDFVCSYSGCQRAFGYKHLLQRHMAKVHSAHSSSSSESETCDSSDEAGETAAVPMGIDFITGNAYATRARMKSDNPKILRCPYPDLPAVLSGMSVSSASCSDVACLYVFSRAYDLRRHLQSEHGVEVEREAADRWVNSTRLEKAGTYR